MLLHASCVAIEDYGVLLVGESGVGKSDVVLRLIDGGGLLVSDDMTKLRVTDGQLFANAPSAAAGILDVRHVGLLQLPFRTTVSVDLYVELVSQDENLERLPDAATYTLLDCPIPWIKLPAYAASTPAKIRAALRYPTIPQN